MALDIETEDLADDRFDQRLRIPSIGSGRWILGCISLLLGLGIYTWLVSSGSPVFIHTNVPGAGVMLDSRQGFSDGAVTSFQRIPFGQRQIQIAHVDYEPVSLSFHHGWFSDRNLTIKMNPRPVRFVVQTLPGAEVLSDGVSLGRADGNGHLETGNVVPGRHQVVVRRDGFMDWVQEGEVHPPEARISAYLAVSPERQRQVEENRQRLNELLRTAQQQFLARQFSNALGAVTEALKLDPNNGEAAALRNRIEQTIKILK